MQHSNLKKLADQNIRQSSTIDTFSMANVDFKKLNGWAVIGMLLVDAKNSLILSEKARRMEFLSAIEELTLSSGLFKNFVLSYSKCFSSSGKNKISLDANNIYSSRPDLKNIHEKILESRNSYVAHNDDENGYDIAIAYTTEDEKEITLAQTYTVVVPYGMFKSFIDAIEFCEEEVIKKINKKLDKLETSLGKKIILKDC